MANFYDLLGVADDADVEEVRDAYRRLARELHPDRSGDAAPDAQRTMALLNEAWATLSDPSRRAAYDRSELSRPAPVSNPYARAARTAPPPGRPVSRRDEWFGGIRLQVVRLGREAGRSAALTLSMRRKGRPRSVYEDCIPGIVDQLGRDTESRVRRARELGTAPLDLWLVTTLIGIRAHVVELARAAQDRPPDEHELATAEMLDRMWDTVAHEVRHGVVSELGGNPHLHRWLTSRAG